MPAATRLASRPAVRSFVCSFVRPAEPITFGFAIALYVDRLGTRITGLYEASNNLRGKLSGAVGAYNAMSLATPEDRTILESKVLGALGLRASETRLSSQIVEPDFVTDLVYAAISRTSVLANLADDMRHLQRSEINEVSEHVHEGQVGSSTMPHKSNPRSFENVKSLWKATMPRMITAFLDQISEHQRDLTNSASSRFIPEILGSADYCARVLTNAMRWLDVNDPAMALNLEQASREIGSEPLYILLALNGVPDAYERARLYVVSNFRTFRAFC